MTHVSPGFLFGLSAAGGLATGAAAVQVSAPVAPSGQQAVVWVAGFVAGFAALLHIIKEMRVLFGWSPTRQSEENLIKEVGALNATIGEMRSDYAAMSQIVKVIDEEVSRLRVVSDGLDGRISQAMSKVSSVATVTINEIGGRLEERQEKFETRLLVLERGGRRR